MAHSIGVEIAKPYWTVTDERTKGNYKYTEKTNNYGTRVTRIENTQTGRAKEVTYIEGEPFELAVSEKRGNYTQTVYGRNNQNRWELVRSSITDGVNTKTTGYINRYIRTYDYSYNNGEKTIGIKKYRQEFGPHKIVLDNYNNTATGVKSTNGITFELTEGLGKLEESKLTAKERKFVLPLVEKQVAKWTEILRRIKV